MASAIIHLAVAKVLEDNLHIENKKDYYLGSIAPDISKQIGQSKQKSHFLYNSKANVPNIKMFTDKYKEFKNNSFELGYYIHLVTDKIWFDEFFETIVCGQSLRLLDGTIIQTTQQEIQNILYSDYSNLNIQIIDEYQMDLSLFYEDFKIPKTKITEIPIEKLNILIDKMGIIIENSKNDKNYVCEISEIKNFIEQTKIYILEKLELNETII